MSSPQLTLAIIAVLIAGLLAHAVAQEAPMLPETEPLLLPLDAQTTVIVSPDGGDYPAIAERLAAGLERLTGARPTIVPDDADPAGLGPGPIIVPGNLMDSALARRLYLHCYDFTDYSWPSPGGHVVRTVRDPFGTGAHALVVGGSDPAGVAAAAEALLAHVEDGGAQLGYVNLVELGEWADEIRGYTERFLGDDDSVWTRVGGAGSWNYQVEIARAGIGYLRTGDEAYLPIFARELRHWFDHYVLNLRTDAPPQTHGFLNTILTVWDLIRDHPAFDDTRHRFDQDWLYVYRSSEGPRKIAREAERTTIRHNHGTRTGLDAVYGGRFFLRRFGEADDVAADARDWLDIADQYFAPQLTSAKPTEDSWGHQWAASLYDTLVYAMVTDHEEYFASDALRQAADRALIAHARGGGPRSYLSACAVTTGDTGFLSGYPQGEAYGRSCAAMRGACDEYLRAFCTDDPVVPREDLLGVTVAPLDQLWYDTIDATGWNPGDLFVVTAEREQCFDKLSIREGWGADDFYLLLDGISGGQHSYQDANCAIIMQEDGATWTSRTGRSLSDSGTVIAGNGVAVALDGSGPGRLHRYARLLYAGAQGDWLACGTALEGVGEADWQRHILRRRGRWTLVVDRVVVRASGEVLAERHWHMRGDIAPRDDGLVASKIAGGRPGYLHLQTAGVLPAGMHGASDRVEVVRTTAAPGDAPEFATLLHVTREVTAPPDWLSIRALDADCSGDPPAPDGVGRLTDLGIVILRAMQPGQWLEMPFDLDEPVAGEVFVDLLGFIDRGDVRVLLDGEEVVARFAHHADGIVPQRVPLGRRELAAGEHLLRLEAVGDAGADGKRFIGLGGVLIRPDGAPAADLMRPADEPEFAVSRAGPGWRVDGGDGPTVVVVGDAGLSVLAEDGVTTIGTAPEAAPESLGAALAAPTPAAAGLLPLQPDCPTIASPWRELKVGDAAITAVARGADGRVAAADASNTVTIFGPVGERLGSAQFESEVLALHFIGEDLMVGEDRGALTRLAPDASQRWQIVIPYVPMPWDYWSEYRSRVREITSADVTGDGVSEVLIANSDRRVHAFTADGAELWKVPVEWGVFTAMTWGQFQGEPVLFGGTSHPSIHGRCIIFSADGKLMTYLTRPDLQSWSIPSQFRDMRQVDLDGDGVGEIINAVDTNCRQLVVYTQEKQLLWDADMAGAAQSIAVAPAADGEAPTVYCGGAAGYVAAFDGVTGERRWACYLGAPAPLLARTADDRIAAATPSGAVYVIRADGHLEGKVELGTEASALVRPGDQREGDVLLLGTADGRVVVGTR